MNEKSLDANVTTHSTRDEFSRSRRRATGDARTDVASVRAPRRARRRHPQKHPNRIGHPRSSSRRKGVLKTPRSRFKRDRSNLSFESIGAHHFFSSFFLSEGRMRFGGSRMRRASTERTRTTLLWIAALMQ